VDIEYWSGKGRWVFIYYLDQYLGRGSEKGSERKNSNEFGNI